MKKHVLAFTVIAFTAFAGIASAQSDEGGKSVGHKGAMQLGINFSTNTSISSSPLGDSAQTNLFGGIDVGRFVSDKFLARFGISGFGTVGAPSFNVGGVSEGGNSMSFNVLGGGLYYLTPQKPQSFYIGGDISFPLSSDGAGSPFANGRVGVQAALRSNASIFVEAGYGGMLSSTGGSSGSLMSNIGVRILF